MSADKISDDELKQILAGCLSQNETSWEQFYRRVYPLVRHSVRRTGLKDDDAEDAVSEVYIRLIESVDQIAATRNPVAYIGAMSRYIAMRMKQQEDRKNQHLANGDHDGKESAQSMRSASLSQEEQVQAKQIREELVKAFQKLSRDNRRLIRLKYVDELCYEEISFIEGRESGALRVATHRAIKAWRALLPDSIANAFNDRTEFWRCAADLELPADDAIELESEQRELIEEYVSGGDLPDERQRRLEKLLHESRSARELKVKLERMVIEREDVRGHCSDEIPPALLAKLMTMIPQDLAQRAANW